MTIIRAEKISYTYPGSKDNEHSKKAEAALKDVSFSIRAGEFVAIIGANGSGKSTLAKLMNALIIPDEGVVYVNGKDTRDERNIPAIRSSVGMVFQNPDNQIIGAVVEEDVAFGPENLGIAPSKIRKNVDIALRAVGMKSFARRSPNYLSGGQKQKVAIAGALAMQPKCLVLDEATSMLDPESRAEVMSVIRELCAGGITIIMVTHNMNEAACAGRILIMDKGQIALDGTPKEIFSDEGRIRSFKLRMPLKM